VTDTASPITEPHLTPMFTTGAQPALSPNTEPHPAPIFDTGPHPDPLQAVPSDSSEVESAQVESAQAEPAQAGWVYAESVEVDPAASESNAWASAEWDSDEWAAAEWRNTDPEPGVDDEPQAESTSDGIDPDLNLALDAIDSDSQAPVAQAFSELENVDTDTFLRSVTGHMQPVVVPPHPVVVPGSYQFVKRWKFALILAGVWVVAAAVGLGFYYWWYTALVKTIPVFGILMYLAVCMVASLLVSMVPNRPQVTAFAIALMGAPLASMAAAAVLHGAYYFEWIARPIVG
jgi:hypothetical protein